MNREEWINAEYFNPVILDTENPPEYEFPVNSWDLNPSNNVQYSYADDANDPSESGEDDFILLP